MIAIRADGNEVIATGHIMRCMAIAEELKKKEECIFIIADEGPRDLILSRGFNYVCLNSKWDNLDSEIDKLNKIISYNGIEKILIDSYYISKEYLLSIKGTCKIIFIDDLGQEDLPVDMIINYNIYSGKFNYSLYKKALIGCKYVPLRKEFRKLTPDFREIPKNILITTGGADIYNISGRLLEAINGNELLKTMNFYVVIGSLNKNKHNLYSKYGESSNIFLKENIQNMAGLMLDCDIAISAAGSTLYELCATGTPTICFSLADNQNLPVDEFGGQNIMINAGYLRLDCGDMASNIINQLLRLVNDSSRRRQMYLSSVNLVDGLGAYRIADVILGL